MALFVRGFMEFFAGKTVLGNQLVLASSENLAALAAESHASKSRGTSQAAFIASSINNVCMLIVRWSLHSGIC